MSLWAKVQQLPDASLQQIRSMYGEYFPIEVRHFLAPWIEKNICGHIRADNPHYDYYVGQFINGLLHELETRASVLITQDLFHTKNKLLNCAIMLRQRYSNNPNGLFTYIKQCLEMEMKLVYGPFNTASLTSMAAEIIEQINVLRQRNTESGNDLRILEREQEIFALQYHERSQLIARIQKLRPHETDLESKLKSHKENLERILNQKITTLLQMRITLTDKLKSTIEAVYALHDKVLDYELLSWKPGKQFIGTSAPFNANFDKIQEWCESLTELIRLCHQKVIDVQRLRQRFAIEPVGIPDLLPTLENRTSQFLSTQVTSSSVVEDPPLQN